MIIILTACSMLIVINFYTIKTLSATRAYVNGESHYSKGHNIATRNLINYLFTSNKKYWIKFKENLITPMGDAKARIALTKALDKETIKQGFREGKNKEEDLDDMIWLFKNFNGFSFFKKAIIEWKGGDVLNAELYQTGVRLQKKIEANQLDFKTKIKILQQLDYINNQIAIKEDNFSNLLGNGTRTVKYYLLLTNIFFICVIIGSISIYYSSMLQKLINSKQELNQQKEQLEAIIKDLERTKLDLNTEIIQHKKIIGTISHDIRSPLKYIQLIAKHLTSTSKKAKNTITYKYANSIYKSSSQLYDFTKTLIEYSKIYIEDKDYNQKRYSVYDLIENKKNFFEEIALNNGTKIINNADINLKSNINIRIISIIIHNLLDNAVKNTNTGIIEIGAQSDTEKITYWVKDTGVGMSPDIIDYYTKLFENRDPEKLILSTYGIGLHLVLELLIILKGDIVFSNPNNDGTTVTIDINLK
ncbi:HAMP domain-containing histidine kinase [Flavobacterium sufflavum]|uniref:histidine kinase n=1 Tax=Flavobacterium sufflavum TaxID=1921138 RepID=A0A3S2U7Y9_9FLAO|nr:HAMP domain-containing sensor histidine kinase [Flavobacterium sufflavum]RVT78390.1 HAMP domain-containing histidine kinase [Flavobacterium sufflavum]